jgi:hypothetical protein
MNPKNYTPAIQAGQAGGADWGASAIIEKQLQSRGVAQPGSAPALGAGGRRFKSYRPDQFLKLIQRFLRNGMPAAVPRFPLFRTRCLCR